MGIAANLALAVPTLLTPARTLAAAGMPSATPLLWPQFAGLLLILLSALYAPAGLDPHRYRLVAWLAVAGRLAGVVFFLLFQSREYRLLGYFDLAFLLPQAWLLAQMGPAMVRPHAARSRVAS